MIGPDSIGDRTDAVGPSWWPPELPPVRGIGGGFQLLKQGGEQAGGLPHSMGMAPTEDGVRDAVERALREDSPSGDITTSSVVPQTVRCRAELRAKAEGVLAGT